MQFLTNKIKTVNGSSAPQLSSNSLELLQNFYHECGLFQPLILLVISSFI